MGGIALQHAALTVSGMVRKLVVAGSRAAAVIVQRPVKEGSVKIVEDDPPAEPIEKLRTAVSLKKGRESICYSFFPHSRAGREHFEKYWSRLQGRNVDDEFLMLDLLDKDGGATNQILATRLDQKQSKDPNSMTDYMDCDQLTMPVLVANGDNDLLIHTSRSWELFTKVEDAQLKIYPNAGHGFIW